MRCPRDIFLWSKLIGGYFVFILPFLMSVIIGLLGASSCKASAGWLNRTSFCASSALSSSRAALHCGLFCGGVRVISIYFDSSKTALIVAFTVWVFAVLILPRVGFLAAQIVAPTSTAESVYREKTATAGRIAGRS